ncbi:MAG: autotransporter domain-containing protein, partial [Methylobacteriaceae bacterium]|nr:autotransporter domain-containing protein [Methylobacteriaceae bacterium]
FLGAAALRIATGTVTEAGGAARLVSFGRDYDIQTVTAGVQGQAALSEALGLGAGGLVLRGLLGYRHAFGDVVPTALLAFATGGPALTVAGVPVTRDALVANAGLDWRIGGGSTLGLAYTGQVGRDSQDHGVKGSFNYRF